MQDTLTRQYKVTDINWDTDGEKVNLPEVVIVEVTHDDPDDDLEDLICNAISDKVGWTLWSFSYEPIEVCEN